MSTINRPSTPFPFMVYPTRTRRESTVRSQPLHFPLPALVSPTPPSLLKRNSSGSSSRVQHSPTPSYVEPTPRRTSSSSCSSSVSSPSMPITPILESASTSTPPPTPFYLPSPVSHNLSLPEPEYNWQHKDLSNTTLLDHFHSAYPTSTVYTPTRPALKRQDTPRPPQQVVQPMSRAEKKFKKLTSVITGKSWVVVA